jgi:hypothetical protein
MEDVGIFHGHLLNFKATWYVYVPPFWYLYQEKYVNPAFGIVSFSNENCEKPRRRGTVDIASASGTESPGSNPARAHVRFSGKNIARI